MNLLLSNTHNIIPFGIIENWADNVCLDTVLVARDGDVRVNFAVLQIFNTWLRDLWHPGETVLLLHCCCGTGVCDIKSDISIEPDGDHNNNTMPAKMILMIMMDSLTSVLVTRKAEKMQIGQVSRKPLDAEAVIEMLNVYMSFNMIEKNLKVIGDYLGRDMIQPNVTVVDIIVWTDPW